MADPQRLEPLQVLGALRAGAGATHRELDEAVRDVHAALAGGQDQHSMFGAAILGAAQRELLPTPPAAAAGLRAELPLEVTEGARIAVSIRASAIADVDPMSPTWTRAMRPHASRGPFLNELGERFWIDTFLLPSLVTVVAKVGAAGAERMLARLPLAHGLAVSHSRTLVAGSVWLPARVLVTSRPENEFVGVRIRGGTARLDGVIATTQSTVTLGGAWKLVLRLELDGPANATAASGPGADASHSVVTLPASVTITLAASGATTIEVGDASASAYGTSVKLTRTQDPPFYDALSRFVVVPGAASKAKFEFAKVRSDTFKIHGSPHVARSGWALPVVVTTPQTLGEAAGAGSVWLELGTPAHAGWTGLAHRALLPKSALALAPGSISFWATVSPADVTHRLRLWNEPGSNPPRASSIDVESVAGSTVLHENLPGAEAVLFAGKAIGHVDRPVAADGGRVSVRMPAAWILLLENAGGTTAGVFAVDAGAAAAPHLAFALENALLKVRPPAWLSASGPLTGDRLESGHLLLRFAHRSLLPTLPDPYAANFEFDRRQDFDQGWATASVGWATPDEASLAFSLQTAASEAAPANEAGLALDAPIGVASQAKFNRSGPARVVLDVSSNADQFGVAFPLEGPSVNVKGLSIVAKARDVAVVTLPPISWEPMLTKTPEPGSGDVPLPPPPHDGGPAMLTADTAEIRPVEPIPLLTAYHDAIRKHRHFAARLPLPFGLVAQVQTRREAQAGAESKFIPGGGAAFFNRPSFLAGLVGGLQLALEGPPTKTADSRDHTLPGYVELRNENDYAKGVLSENIRTRFDGDFGIASPNGVPVRRYELSGYGASLLSDWRDPEAVGPAIIEARFDVFVGRTSHEVIQMQSVLHPWFIRVVRTITIDRTRGGWVLREDSGWVAASDGRFHYAGDAKGVPPVLPAFPTERRHPGAVEGVVNVRNIRLDGAQFDIAARAGTGDPPTIWQAATFDADVLFVDSANPRLKTAMGSAARRTPARGLTGWIHIGGPTYTTKSDDGQSVLRVRPADARQVFDLLLLRGPAKAPIECALHLGGTDADPGLVHRATRVDVRCNDDSNVPHLVAAVLGSPVLPRDGAWSLARIAAADPAPNALAPSFPIPLVGPNAWQPGFGRWHFADATDITRLGDASAPVMRYGFVQSLGTQKVFFARPRVGNDPDPITLPHPPQLADMGALLNAAGVFPGLADAFDFQTLKALSVAGGDLGFSETFLIGTKAAPKEAVLIDLGGADALQVVIEYHDETGNPTAASITVNPAASPRWQLSLARACFAVRFKGNALISIFASVKADELSAPNVVDLNVRYEGILSALQTIFSNIQQVARFLPGGAGAGLNVGFSQGKLTVTNSFALPSLPLGAGQITDIAAEMGFHVGLSPVDVRFIAGLGSSEKPFRWIVSPLAGTGVVQVAISGDGLDILVQCGLGIGLAIDLGIASGSASVALALELNTGPDPFELRAILSGRASVDVLAGLASATITLAAGLGIIPPANLLKPPYLPPSIPPPNPIGPFDIGLTASVSVGIHISLCWVVDVDWDGYWQYRQDIHIPAIDIPLL